MKYRAWVDRIESDKVVLDFEGLMFNIPKILLGDVKEGDCIFMQFDKDENEREKRQEEIKDLMDELWK